MTEVKALPPVDDLQLRWFRRMRDEEPQAFANAQLVILESSDFSEEAKARALERIARVEAEK